MVSTIQFDAIPKPTVSYIRRRPKKVAAYVIAVLVIVALQQVGLLLMLGVYLLHGLGMAVYRLVDALTTPVPGEDQHDASRNSTEH
jgi:CDP-diacylglycerol--serine O-phosphatidyltransferase